MSLYCLASFWRQTNIKISPDLGSLLLAYHGSMLISTKLYISVASKSHLDWHTCNTLARESSVGKPCNSSSLHVGNVLLLALLAILYLIDVQALLSLHASSKYMHITCVVHHQTVCQQCLDHPKLESDPSEVPNLVLLWEKHNTLQFPHIFCHHDKTFT